MGFGDWFKVVRACLAHEMKIRQRVGLLLRRVFIRKAGRYHISGKRQSPISREVNNLFAWIGMCLNF